MTDVRFDQTEGIDTLVANSQQNVSTITLNMRLNAKSLVSPAKPLSPP